LKENSLIRVQNNFLFDFQVVNDLVFLQRFQQIFCSRTFGSLTRFLFSLLGEFGFLLCFGLSLPLQMIIPIEAHVRHNRLI
jgi:hypothetical protein